MCEIEWHADDYGMTKKQSIDIINCYYNGCLNGVSIMPNSQKLNECMRLIESEKEKIIITVHLNLIEGYCCTKNREEVSLLTNSDGIFKLSFFNLLVHSFIPGRKKYKEQIYVELSSQIEAVKEYVDFSSIRLDSHVHYHMIPVVFDSILDIVKMKNLNVEYIRVPNEPISIYIRNLFSIKNIKFINIVKVLILKFLAVRNEKRYRRVFKKKIPTKVFMGVMLSGHMFLDDVKKILPSFIKLAQKKQSGLEVLFHPGGIYEEEEIRNITNLDDCKFLKSNNRNLEAATLINIEKEFL